MNLKIAAVQFELRREETVHGYLAHVEGLVAQAAATGSELVILPEFASVGLLGTITDHAVTSKTVATDYRERLAPLYSDIASGTQDIARRHGVTLLGGSHNRVAADGSLRNTAILAHADGTIEEQDKIHLTPPEHEMGAVGGDSLLVTKIGPFTAGVLICADIQFPELSRHLVQAGVDLLLCPSLTWNRRGAYRVRTGCAARAIENQLYVVMSPLVGSSGFPVDAPMYDVGQALVTTPVDRTFGLNDGLLAISTTKAEEILTADLDHDLLLASREKPEAPGLKLQRPDLYRLLAEKDG